jgi:hypothetical protein
MNQVLTFVGPLMAAGALSAIVYWLARNLRIERGVSRQLSDFQGD